MTDLVPSPIGKGALQTFKRSAQIPTDSESPADSGTGVSRGWITGHSSPRWAGYPCPFVSVTIPLQSMLMTLVGASSPLASASQSGCTPATSERKHATRNNPLQQKPSTAYKTFVKSQKVGHWRISAYVILTRGRRPSGCSSARSTPR